MKRLIRRQSDRLLIDTLLASDLALQQMEAGSDEYQAEHTIWSMLVSELEARYDVEETMCSWVVSQECESGRYVEALVAAIQSEMAA